MTSTHRQLVMVGASIVTLVTVLVSGWHLIEVSVKANAGWLAWTTPVAVDFLGAVAAVSLWASRQAGESPRVSAVIGLVVSLVGSIAGNLVWPYLGYLTPADVEVLSAVVAVLPAVCLAISIELVLSAIGSPEPTRVETVTESVTLVEHSAPAGGETLMTEVPTVVDQRSNEHWKAVTNDPLDLLRAELESNPSATSFELAPKVGRSASWVRTKRSELLAG